MSQMPDKIWLHKNTKYNTGDEVFGYQYECAQEIMCEGIENFVKYIPADAFIEKACEYWYQYNRDIVKRRCSEFTVHVEDFRKYLED